MNRRTIRILLVAIGLGLSAQQAAAIDKTVDTILDIVLQEMAPELKPAKPFIVCLIDTAGNAESCVKSFVGQSAAAAKGQTLEEAKKNMPFDPDSPDIKLVMEIVQAATDGNWGVVIGKGGPYVARAVICAVFVPPGVKSFGCPVIGYVIKHQAGLVKQVLDKLKSGDVPGLVSLLVTQFGPDIVCELIPSSALPAGASQLKDIGCSAVGKILSGAMMLAEAAANLAVEGVDETWDLISGGNDYMPYNDYYSKYWRPGYHYGTWVCLDSGGSCKYPSGKGNYELLTKPAFHKCWSYYDDHDHWEDDAKKVCTGMLNVFNKEVGKIAAAMKAAAQVHAGEEVPKLAKQWAPADWGKAAAMDRKKQFQQQCANAMMAKFPFPPSSKQPPVTAWTFVCKAPADKFVAEYAAAQKQVAETITKLEALGCKKTGSAVAPKISCASYEGYDACKNAYGGKLPCALDTSKADSALAEKILKQLGTKRCKITDEVKPMPCPKKDGTMGICPQHYKYVACSRPWKVDQCKTLVNQYAGKLADNSSVKCRGDEAGLAAFHKLAGQASAIRNTLNGAGGPIGTKEGLGDVKAKSSAGTGSCKTGEPDSLQIHCGGGEFAAHPEIGLPACPVIDPNLDGADVPCRLFLLEVVKEQGLKAPKPLDPAVGDVHQAPAQDGGAKQLPPMMAPPPSMAPPPVLVPAVPSAATPPASGTGGRQAAPPVVAPAPGMTPPPGAAGMPAPAVVVPGCTPVAGAPGQYACTTREAYAGCERLRAAGSAGIRACNADSLRHRP